MCWALDKLGPLLDTNIISEVRKGANSNVHVSNWYAGIAETRVFVSCLTIGEIRKGIELAERRRDFNQAAALNTWLRTARALVWLRRSSYPSRSPPLSTAELRAGTLPSMSPRA